MCSICTSDGHFVILQTGQVAASTRSQGKSTNTGQTVVLPYFDDHRSASLACAAPLKAQGAS